MGEKSTKSIMKIFTTITHFRDRMGVSKQNIFQSNHALSGWQLVSFLDGSASVGCRSQSYFLLNRVPQF